MTRPTKLLNKNFVLLWQGQLVSLFGVQAYSIAMMFWIKHQTGSATLMGLVMMVSQIPGVVLGPISGVFVDRYSRWKIIVGSDLIRGIITIALAALVFLIPDEKNIIIMGLFTIGLISSTIGAFFNPAITAAIPELVPTEKLATANSMHAFSYQASNTVGMGIGGVLFRIMGAWTLFFIDGITYVFSAISEMFIKIPQHFPEKKTDSKSSINRLIDDIKEGFLFIWKNKGMRDLFFTATLLNFFLVPGMVLTPFFVEDYLMATSDWFGYITGGFGLGTIIGFVFAGGIKVSGLVRSKINVTAIILLTLFLTLFGFIRAKQLAVANMFMAGIMGGFFNVNLLTILQQTTPDWIRGRVFAVLTTITGALTPVAMGMTGVITDLLNQNVPLVLIGGGALSFFSCIILAFSRAFREYMAYEPGPEEMAVENGKR
jgi:DHA3 family macrolide efflux protein-like MFS transporter